MKEKNLLNAFFFFHDVFGSFYYFNCFLLQHTDQFLF